MSEVVLVNLPYAPLERPSLALGILKAAAESAGISCRLVYTGFAFAEEIGVGTYNGLSWLRADMLGEWTFAGAAFPDFAPDHDAYLRRAAGDAEFLPETLRAVREKAPAFIARMAADVAAMRPRIVGCSSTFNQHCAVLAFTRELKRIAPDVVTIVGGANCEAEMGLATRTHFPWIDYVVSGEADELFPAFCRRILDGACGPLPFGVLGAGSRRPAPGVSVPRASVERLDAVPVPDFDDYFAALGAFSGRARIDVGLPVETARGCWWGEIKHCTFCGLNGDGGMRFRVKSPARAVAELRELRRRHGVRRFHVVDNILDLAYFESVVPALAGNDLSIFLEIKANVTRAQLQALFAAGVVWVQPGIESLHDAALAHMAKGTRAWINVQLLKWAREIGQHVSWNVLCGFPGEDDAWYAETAAMVPLLEHLQAPSNGLRRIRFDRFSPHQKRPADFALRLRPGWAYRYVYPLDDDALRDLVYVFEDADGPVRGFGGPGRDALAAALDDWAARFRGAIPSILCMTEEADRTTIVDTRRVAPERRVVLRGTAHRVHRACAAAQTPDGIARALAADGGPAVKPAAIRRAIDDLVARKLVLETGGRALALAVAGEVPTLPLALEDGYPGGCVRRKRHGERAGVDALVQPRAATFAEPLPLASGRTLSGWTIAYETYGTLAPAGDNAILVCHPLTGDAHAAGRHAPGDPRPGWWDAAIGPGRALDTNRWFVVATAAIGGSGGSTGPASIDPATGRPWATDFPVVGVSDIVRAQRPLLDRLGIRRLHAVIGGCFGGQQALTWAIHYPELVERVVALGVTAATSAHTIALFALLRRLVRSDPAWRDGRYHGHGVPRDGIGAALAAALPVWMNREAMERRFGRRRAGDATWTLGAEFAVERFIDEVAAHGADHLDANALLYLTRAEEYFDLAGEYGSLEAALAPIRARALLVSFANDWRYPSDEVARLAAGIARGRHVTVASPLGHDAIRWDVPSWAGIVAEFIGGASDAARPDRPSLAVAPRRRA